MKIGLLDFGDGSEKDSLVDSVLEYAVLADKLGFSRLWLGEHYASYTYWCNPEILIPIIAGTTEKIRVGAAGLLINAHSSYRVALNFKMLASLFPGRIDLGLANAPPPPKISTLLSSIDGGGKPAYIEKVKELVHYFEMDKDQQIENEIFMPPDVYTAPDIWLLSKSFHPTNLDHALNLKLNYSRSIFHPNAEKQYQLDLLEDFKGRYFNMHKTYPKVNIAFAGVCHKTSQQAQKIVDGLGAQNIPDESRLVVGCRNFFSDKLEELVNDYGVDEVIFLNLARKTEDKITGIELISEALKLLNKESLPRIY